MSCAALAPVQGSRSIEGAASAHGSAELSARHRQVSPNAVHLSASIRNMVYWYLVEHSIYCGCVPCLNSIGARVNTVQLSGNPVQISSAWIGKPYDFQRPAMVVPSVHTPYPNSIGARV